MRDAILKERRGGKMEKEYVLLIVGIILVVLPLILLIVLPSIPNGEEVCNVSGTHCFKVLYYNSAQMEIINYGFLVGIGLVATSLILLYKSFRKRKNRR